MAKPRSRAGEQFAPRSANDFAAQPFVTPVEERVRRTLIGIAIAAAIVIAWAFGL